ncbi:MAG TPA: hypothetical protein VJK51_02345 [Candidatus Nanoarchaeia archaeon]|nr:hypothetical protein [Candidatus Nanoarchaeia archaeon]
MRKSQQILEEGRATDLKMLKSIEGKVIAFAVKQENSPYYTGVANKVGLNNVEITHITWLEPSVQNRGGEMARTRRIYATDYIKEIECEHAFTPKDQIEHFDYVCRRLRGE